MTATRSWRPTSSWPRPRGCWRCRWSPPSITARCWGHRGAAGELVQSTFQKMHFSSAREPGFEGLAAGRKTVLVTGCEAHICVLQTVIGLTELGYRAVLVSDAAEFAQTVTIMRRCAARGTWRGYRHHRNGDLRVDGNLRAPALSRRVTSGQIAAPAATLSPGNAKIISLFDTIPGQTSQRRGEYFAILRAPTEARSQPAGSSAFPGTRTGVPS